MVRGLYSSAAGALVAQATIDNVANNLANAATSGFKRTLLQVESQPSMELFRIQTDPGKLPVNRLDGVSVKVPVGRLGSGSQVYDTPTIFDQGQISINGNPLSFALSGPGFFAVRSAAGQIRYTRDGAFARAADGQLVTQAGDQILNRAGQPVVLPSAGKIEVDAQGNINVNGQVQGQIAVTEFNNLLYLRPEGANDFIDVGAGARPSTNTAIIQGAEEKSNADVVRSIVDLITAQRWFDTNEKSIQTQNDATNLAITTVGRTG